MGSARRPGEHRSFLTDHFTGREQELDALEKAIRDKLAEAGAFGIWGVQGVGGVGKSTLAAHLAERLWVDETLFPGGVLWTNLRDETPAQAAARWLRQWEQPTAEDDRAVAEFRRLVAERRPLLVLDNVQTPEQAEALSVPGVVRIITTRERANLPLGTTEIPLDPLPRRESLELLAKVVPQAAAQEPDAADEVCGLCNDLPLLIEAAAKAIRSRKFRSLRHYADELNRRGLDALADYDRRAAVIWDASYDKLDGELQALFGVLSHFPTRDFSSQFAATYAGLSRDAGHARLMELVNVALLIEQPGRPISPKSAADFGEVRPQATPPDPRFRFHDRVQDYAHKKLAEREGGSADVPARLSAVWTDWEYVRTELRESGVFELSRQYHLLRERWAAPTPEFQAWYHFIRGQSHVLAQRPELFFQQALNEARHSPVSRAARNRRAAEVPEHFWEWLNRPTELQPSACEQTLAGHSDRVESVALSADGRRAISGSADGTIRVWDLATGRCEQTLEGHSSSVTSVALSVDGQRAISGSEDQTVRVWDLATGRCEQTLEGHSSSVTSVALSVDGQRAISGSEDQTVRVWDLATGRCEQTLEGHSSSVTSVALSVDGQRAISGSEDQTVRVWDLATGRCEQTLEGHSSSVTSVALSVDGQRAISGSEDQTVRVWDLATGRCEQTLEGHSDWVTSVALCVDGRRAISGSEDKTVWVWDLATGRCEQTLEGHSSSVTSVALSVDGQRAISGSADQTVRVWDLATGRCEQTLAGHSNWVKSVALSADGRRAISGSWDQTVRVWDLATGRCEATYDHQSPEAEQAWLRTAASEYRTSATDGLWLYKSGHEDAVAQFPGQFRAGACSPDGRYAVAGAGNGRVYLLRHWTRDEWAAEQESLLRSPQSATQPPPHSA